MTVPVVATEAHRDHVTMEFARGRMAPSPESPDRADLIAAALRRAGHEFVEPSRVDLDAVRRVHTAEYVDFLTTAWDRWIEHLGPGAAESGAVAFTWPRRDERAVRPDDVVGRLGYHSFAGDSPIVAGTWGAVCASAATAQAAVDLLAQGTPTVYALCRPPGHHATADQLGGYCYLNNSAVAAQRLLDAGHGRVAVLDVDYHHGNGTQSIFERRSDVLTASLHADPQSEFPWFSGHADETGIDEGEGSNLNLPLARGTAAPAWFDALDRAIGWIGDPKGPRSADASAPIGALVVALGLDTYVGDPLGTFGLDTGDFVELGERIAGIGVPTVLVQEGGYATDALGRNVAAVLDGVGRASRVRTRSRSAG